MRPLARACLDEQKNNRFYEVRAAGIPVPSVSNVLHFLDGFNTQHFQGRG
jgi:hypothetical protein